MHAHLSRQIVVPYAWQYTKEAVPISVLSFRTKTALECPRPGSAHSLDAETAEPACIYVVDDEPRLTKLYAVILAAAGYVVRAFNDRVEALVSLRRERRKPDLLIMDYSGHTMPADRFMQRCLFAHPMLRILMASGFEQTGTWYAMKPDRFLRKPFTAEEFLAEVRATLTA